jgi:hypothetical protein
MNDGHSLKFKEESRGDTMSMLRFFIPVLLSMILILIAFHSIKLTNWRNAKHEVSIIARGKT